MCFDLKSTSYNFINELEARFKIKRKLMSIIIHPCYNLQQKVTCAITSWEEHVHEYIKNQISKIYIFRGLFSGDLAFRLEIHTNQLPFSPYYKRTNIFLYQCFRLGAYYNIAFCYNRNMITFKFILVIQKVGKRWHYILPKYKSNIIYMNFSIIFACLFVCLGFFFLVFVFFSFFLNLTCDCLKVIYKQKDKTFFIYRSYTD